MSAHATQKRWPDLLDPAIHTSRHNPAALVARHRDREWAARLAGLSIHDVDVVAAWRIALHLPVELPRIRGRVVLVAAVAGAVDGDVPHRVALPARIRSGYL